MLTPSRYSVLTSSRYSVLTPLLQVPLLRAELDKRGLVNIAIAASDENTYDLATKYFPRTSLPMGGAPFLILQPLARGRWG